MRGEVVNLGQKAGSLAERWSPHIVERVNDLDVKVVWIEGEFVWHTHEATDELFLVLEGRLTIETREASVELAAGDLYVVPRGVEHRPVAIEACRAMLLEPRGTVNTGESESELTAPGERWI